MTYKPPFARMRQIRRDAPPPMSRSVPNVEAALARRIETVFVVEEPEIPIEEVAAPIEEVAAPIEEVAAPVEVEPDEPEEPKKDPPKFYLQMKKYDLLSAALGMGLAVDDGFTKTQILNALKVAVGQ